MKILNLLFLAACVSPLSSDNSKESERLLNSVPNETPPGKVKTMATNFLSKFLAVTEIEKNDPQTVNITTEENSAQESLCHDFSFLSFIESNSSTDSNYPVDFLPFYLNTGAIRALIDTHQEKVDCHTIENDLRQKLFKSQDKAFKEGKDFKSIEIFEINLLLSRIKKNPNHEIPLKFFYNLGDINAMYKDFNNYIKNSKAKNPNRFENYVAMLANLDQMNGTKIEKELKLQKMIYLCQKRELRSLLLKKP